MSQREEFLTGARPADVHIFLHESALSNAEALASHGEAVGAGTVLVLDGEKARSTFQTATGIDPMEFAQEAMGTDGEIDEECTDGICPDGTGEEHYPKFIFAFAEEQNEAVGGLYAEGPVIHAYAACACGTRYSDKWVAE